MDHNLVRNGKTNSVGGVRLAGHGCHTLVCNLMIFLLMHPIIADSFLSHFRSVHFKSLFLV